MTILNMVYYKVVSWWQPWANTIAYYPLKSNTNDYSWNWYNLTNLWNVTFGTYQWVNCAIFNGTSNSQLYNTSISYSAYPTQTVAVWIYVTWTSSGVYQTIYHIGTAIRYWKLGTWFNYNTWLCLWSWDGQYESVKAWNINWAWHLLVNVTSGSSSVQYLDWVEYQTFTNSLSYTQTWLYVWWAQSTSAERLTWYESELILENKARTAQEITDYYNLTKWDYWL